MANTIPAVLESNYHSDDGQVFLTLLYPENKVDQYSYSELLENASHWSACFSELGLQQGDRIIIILPHSSALYFSYCGALIQGFVPALFAFPSPKLSEVDYFHTIDELITQSHAKLIVTYPELALKLSYLVHKQNKITHILTPKDIEQQFHSKPKFIHSLPEDIAILQYSSGTTGLKKGIALSHKAILWQISEYARSIELSVADRIASWLPLYHDMGLIACLYLPLIKKIPLIAMSPFDWIKQPQILFTAITQYQANLCWLPNFSYNYLANNIHRKSDKDFDLSHMKAFINCSEPVLAESHQVFYQRFENLGLKESALQCSYAMAENTFAVTSSGVKNSLTIDAVDANILADKHVAKPVNEKNQNTRLFVSCGTALKNVEIKILGSSFTRLAERQVGEIAIKSPGLFSKYDNNPVATQSAFQQDFYLTGDLGYLANGELFVIGRSKDTIIIAGKNIYPQDIEQIVNQQPQAIPGRNVAFGIDDKATGTQKLVIIVETDIEAEQDKKQFRETIYRAVAAKTEVNPADICLVSRRWLVKSTSGKLSRSLTREKYLSENQNTNIPAILTETNSECKTSQEKIRACIKNIMQRNPTFNVKKLENDEPLISGGLVDSLSVSALLTALESAFNCEIPEHYVAEISNFDTVNKITKIMDTIVKSAHHTSSTQKGTIERSKHWQKHISQGMLSGEDVKKYQLAPQLKDSDHIPTRVDDVLGRLSAPNFKSYSLNTDDHGFRLTVAENKPVTLNAFNTTNLKRGAIAGNSAAYGVGASNDSNTFISKLLQKSNAENLWFNFSLRASTLKQERLAVAHYAKNSLDYFVWFSGFNELNFFLTEVASIFKNRYLRKKLPAGHLISSDEWWKIYDQVITNISNQIEQLRESNSHSKICFCLQPLLTWISKPLTSEEQELITIFDTTFDRPLRRAMPYIIEPLYPKYAKDIKAICIKNNIDFVDFNQNTKLQSEEWLFIDRVHLTDKAHQIIAEEIFQWLN